MWVLDPIDGTFNYAAGSPMAAILLGLLRDGEPVAGLTWLPFTEQRYTAVARRPVYDNGVAQPRLELAATGRFDGRHRHIQRGLARPIPRSVPVGVLEQPQPGMLPDAHARRDRR